MVRTTSGEDISFGAPQTVPGSALVNGSLPAAAAFPASLNLGGSKAAGGAQRIIRSVAGGTTLAQTDGGSIVQSAPSKLAPIRIQPLRPPKRWRWPNRPSSDFGSYSSAGFS